MKGTKKNAFPKGREIQAIIQVEDPAVLNALAGDQDHNLRIIENELDIEIGHAHDGISLEGQDSEVELAQDLLVQLKDVIERGNIIQNGDIERSIRLLSSNRKLKLEEIFREQVKVSGKKNSIGPKTPMQREYLDAIRGHDLTFGIGPAGTGKTYLAMSMAVSSLLNKEVKRIVLCRPAVEAGEKIGFLPGDMAEKVNPYLRPLYDALHDMVEVERAAEMIEKGIIEVAPLAFMRGRTLSNAAVILDEAQNTTIGQMQMLLTRLGQGSKCIVTGDVTQVDLPRGVSSGLVDALQILKGVKGIAFVHFGEEDVVRHHLVARIVGAYSRRKDSHE